MGVWGVLGLNVTPATASAVSPELLQVGVGGLLALLILREVFQFISAWLNGRSRTGPLDRRLETAVVLERDIIPLLQEIKGAQHEDAEIVRDRLHRVASMLQTLINYWESAERRGDKP